MMIEAKLTVIGGDSNDEFELELPATIGRGKDNSITLRDSLISRQHCRISHQGAKLIVTDLDSLNGTYIGRDRIAGSAELPPGGLLTVGTVTFRAVYGGVLANDLFEHEQHIAPSVDVLDDDTVDIGEAGTMIDPGDETTRPQKHIHASSRD